MDLNGAMGRFGILHYLKRNENAVVASYPIDEEITQLGRDTTCDIRMWYEWVSHLHCKVMFVDGKAFLVVLGGNGAIVDGSPFFPSKSGPPTTIPLTNGSEFEIYNRRFMFRYPPKDQRAKLMATPRPKSRKSLRLSMITSAVVFTPGPSASSEENWAKLQTPVKPFVAETIKDEEVTVVEGDRARVLQFEKDLIVMEECEPAPEDSPSTRRVSGDPMISSTENRAQPSTTPRRSLIQSLHKAVLVRNSQRALALAMEEDEVEEAVSPERRMSSDEEEEEIYDQEEDEEIHDQGEREMHDQDETDSNASETSKEDEEQALSTKTNSGGIRAGLLALGSMLPFVGQKSSATLQDMDEDPNVDNEPAPLEAAATTLEHMEDFANPLDSDSDEEPEDRDIVAPARHRHLGSFLTPQVSRQTTGDSRLSIGSKLPSRCGLDLEAAKRRMSHLGKAQRPTRPSPAAKTEELMQSSESGTTLDKPVFSQDKEALVARRRTILAPEPELPLPSSRRQQRGSLISTPLNLHSVMTPSSVSKTSEERLQELKRKVDEVTQRDSIRESRRSFVSRDDFPFLSAQSREVPSVQEETFSQVQRAEDADIEMAEERAWSPSNERAPDHAPPMTPQSRSTRDIVSRSTAQAIITPSYRGVRDLFKAERASNRPDHSPYLTGVRNLFRVGTYPQTPAFSGLRDLLRTPTDPPSTPLYTGLADMYGEGECEDDHELELTRESQEEVASMLLADEPPSLVSGIAVDDVFKLNEVGSLGGQDIHVFNQGDIVGQDPDYHHASTDELPGAVVKAATTKASRSRITRTSKPSKIITTTSNPMDLVETGDQVNCDTEVERAETPRPARRGRRQAAAPLAENETAVSVDSSSSAPGSSSKGRKAKTVQEGQVRGKSKPTRAARVKAEVPEESEVEATTVSATTAKPNTTNRTRGMKQATQSEDAVDVKSDCQALDAKPSRGKRSARYKPSDEEIVELVVDAPKIRASRTKATTPESEQEPVPNVRTSTRSKLASRDISVELVPAPKVVRSKQILSELPEEVAEEEGQVKPAKRSTRTAKPAQDKPTRSRAVKGETIHTEEAPATTIPKSSKKGKKALEAIVLDDVEDKENSAEAMEERPVATVRSRNTTGSKVARVKEDVAEPVTRITRTRARK